MKPSNLKTIEMQKRLHRANKYMLKAVVEILEKGGKYVQT